MKRFIFLFFAVILGFSLLMSPSPAAADRFHGHGGWGGHHFHGGHGGFHGRVFIGVGPGYWPGYYWGYYPYYWGPSVVGWPYYPPTVTEAPPVYSEPPQQQQPYYWYYCPNPEGYYPYVKSCPGGWVPVVPRENPPSP